MDALWLKTNELIKKALELWDARDWNIEEIDPVVRLLFAAVANESLQLEKDIRESAFTVKDNLVNSLLPPSITGPRPACAMIQATPVETQLKLNDKFIFEYQMPVIQGNAKEDSTISFRPVNDATLLKASVKYIFTFDRLVSLSDFQQFNSEKHEGSQNSIWMALKADNAVNSLDGLPVFFDLIQPGLKGHEIMDYDLSDNVKLWFDNRELALVKPIDTDHFYRSPDDDNAQFSYNFAAFAGLQAEVLSYFSDFYYRIVDTDPRKSRIQKVKYPEFFTEIFEHEVLKLLRDELIWLEFRFNGSHPDLLKTIGIHINAFPVINHKLKTIYIDKEEPVKKIPVSDTEELIGVISYKAFDEYRMLVKTSRATQSPFIVRDIEMEKYSHKDLVELIEEMVDRFISDNQAFQEEYRISIEDMNKLREALKPVISAKHKSLKTLLKHSIYAIFNPGNRRDILSVELLCSLTNGLNANGIAAGERLKSMNASISQNEVFFLTKTMNGRNTLTADEKAIEVKRLMMSGDKLVTTGDVKEFCFAELGKKIKNINLSTTSYRHETAIRRCLKVDITLIGEADQNDDLILIKKSLEHKIRLKSNMVLPVKISLNRV
ncbi:MAG: type VI secretion system baseplate subunit TssF [Lentimicrobium sp.]